MSSDSCPSTFEWKSIHLDEYKTPSEPPTEAVRLGLRSWWQQLVKRRHPTPAEDNHPPDLTSAPAHILAYLVPTLDWNQIHSSMMATVWSQHDFAASPCALFVAPPYCEVGEAVLEWAQAEGAIFLPEPTVVQILDSPRDWFQSWPKDTTTQIVIPALERCFLRHQRGLHLVRQLIDDLVSARRRCVIVCNSWSWAFLEHACPTNLISARPWTSAPLAAPDLQQIFAHFMRQTTGTDFAFRRANNGKITLPMTPEDQENYSDEFLTHVAAHSRGNPVVAWAIWQRSLLVSAEIAEQEEENSARVVGDQDQRRNIWVQSWEKLQEPPLPFPIEDRTAFVLHAILLHNGLSTPLLHRLLPVFPVDLARARCSGFMPPKLYTNTMAFGKLPPQPIPKSGMGWRSRDFWWTHFSGTLGLNSLFADTFGCQWQHETHELRRSTTDPAQP